MANSDISVSSVDHRQEPSPSTTFSIYGLAACLDITTSAPFSLQFWVTRWKHVSKIDRRTTKLRPASTNSPTSTTITADPRSQCCQHQQQTACYPPYVRNTRLWAISETCITSSKFRFTVPGFDVIQHPATGPGRRGIALGIHRALVAMNMRLQRIVHSWGHGLTVMQFSGSQITRLSTVHGRRHSSIDHFVCNAPARALLTSPRVDRQTAVADHFVIRTSIRAEAQGQPPAPRAPTISRHHCLEATDRIATSNYLGCASRRCSRRHRHRH
ncbi:hypothetical protein BASA81_017161 [Batrachochytrium salamandrivorans]|nr:hypothetical protein BASA81_017161 [Batrachochytrium salamandrivorans]